jgi:hypothetical protein
MMDGAQRRVLQLDHPGRSGVMVARNEYCMSAVPWLPEGHLWERTLHTS